MLAHKKKHVNVAICYCFNVTWVAIKISGMRMFSLMLLESLCVQYIVPEASIIGKQRKGEGTKS